MEEVLQGATSYQGTSRKVERKMQRGLYVFDGFFLLVKVGFFGVGCGGWREQELQNSQVR